MIGMNVAGAGEVVTQLFHAGERVKDGARKAMHRVSDRIVKEAKLNCPVDKHNLEESIHAEKDYERNGRLTIKIVVGGTVNGVNVDAYAAEVHEHYESMHPGPGTIAKRIANPSRYVGEKFLERAVKDNEEYIFAHILAQVSNDWTAK